MPAGIPVATVAINGSANAAILAAQILATKDERLVQVLQDFKRNMAEKVTERNSRLQEKLAQYR